MKGIILLAGFCLTIFLTGADARAQGSAEDHFKRSHARLASRDLDGAMVELDKALALKSDYAEAYAQRSRLQMMKGLVDAALADISKAIEHDPGMTLAYVERGQMRMLKNDPNGALSDFDNAIARGHRSDEIYSSRGHVKAMRGDFEGAISDFTVAISLNPKRIGYYNARASVRSVSGDEAGALVDINYIIEQYEKRERERAVAGKGKEQAPLLGLESPPIAGPETVLPSQNSENKDSASKVIRQAQTQTVVTMSTDSTEMRSVEDFEYLHNVSGAYVNRGMMFSKQGDSEAAVKDFDKALEINPRGAIAYYGRGRERQKRGDWQGAYDDFTKAIGPHPNTPFVYLERGVTLLLMGRDAEAEQDFDKFAAFDQRFKKTVEIRRAEALKKREENRP